MLDIEGFKNYLYEEELSPNTIDTYILGIRKYVARYDEVTKANLIDFKKWLMERFKPQTVNLRITAVLKYCKYKDIPMTMKHIKEPKKTYIDNVISVQQYEKLMNKLKTDNQIRWYFNILLLAKTGMRISEAIRVKKKDIYAGSVTMHTKAHMRTIYFPKSLAEELSPYLENLKDDDTVMRNKWGKAITSRGISEGLQKFARKYDIPKEVMHPHAFRHFFAIEFLKRNSNISLLADLLGHGSINVTQIYLRQSQEEQQKAIDEAVDW
ncbi:MAG: tyrosine-type recombinase/integrase [Ruminococcus sp.]|nr:tyrosine-type recombinase/integrase [Ruminococcus sp.]